ncbi:N-acetylneuraminate synthase [Methanococcus aeolicus Nankai-3]|uniref:N-acetylneuraminate synthase n=1 Tax=Methanococcus aeolicus (strain ATCC BAA-1280 / DSM 17508 / OCM 812 / Nankai-3) TaxID=419665 RepID=A6UU34_META3|nr:N-acetylneuraminate synthase [Methanococcus aeolicus]ABR56006.1 N-acetylneuraminate synthase [Methanococcus aeolicus Nankai-3]
MKKIKIENKYIGENEPVFIIAEAGVNHNGDIELAKKLIDIASECGADAVKFQTFKAEKVVSKRAPKAEYQTKNTGTDESQYEMIKELELTEDDFYELYKYSKNKNIMFLSTPFDFESADYLDELMPLFKISSTDLNNLPFLEYIAKKKKPIILSTGMGTLGEIDEAINIIKKANNNDIILLHCVTNYPASFESLNLRVIRTLKEAFKLPVGFSDHSLGIYAPISAVSLGATVIEKHFTLDKNLPGPDHKASLSPEELKEMVSAIRSIEKALGNGIKRPTSEEEKIKKVARRSLVANVDIPKGATIKKEMIVIKRPGTGIEPKYLNEIMGKKVKRDIKIDEILKLGDIEW